MNSSSRSMVALLLAFAACTKEAEEDVPRRPADAPDVFLIMVSGHCLPVMGLCGGNFNPEYLSHSGAVDALAEPMMDADLDVYSAVYVDGWYTWVDTEDEVLAAGFLDLVGVLKLAKTAWMDGYANPTRIVLVGHGHGVVWTHLAAYAAPQVPIEVLVDLDGMSAGWDDDEGYFGVGDDWPASIPGFVADGNQTWPIDDWKATDSWPVIGITDPQDIEDVVPPNVVLNLEVHSTPNPFQEESDVFDADPNNRIGGGMDSIKSFVSGGEHYFVYEPESDSMDWVARQILKAL